jgi:anthranilate phosphoribosyltransferase
MKLADLIHDFLISWFKRKTNFLLFEEAWKELYNEFPVNRLLLLRFIVGEKGLISLLSASALSMTLGAEPEPNLLTALYKIFKERGDFKEESSHFIEATANIGWGRTDFDTINVGTTSCIVSAAAGAKMVKSSSSKFFSKSGSGDLLQFLSMPRLEDKELAMDVLQATNLAFLRGEKFSPTCTKFSRRLVSAPSELLKSLAALTYPLRYAFVLMNPLGCVYGVRGLGIPYARQFSEALALIHPTIKRNITLYGVNEDGTILDEATVSGITYATIYDGINHKSFILTSEDLTSLGLQKWKSFELKVEEAKQGYKVVEKLLKGELTKDSPFVHLIALNSAFNLWAYGTVKDLKDGVELSLQTIQDGLGYEKIQQYREYLKERGGKK